jgi:hypothetical protein
MVCLAGFINIAFFQKLNQSLKVGLAWYNGPWKLGVTLTTPSPGLFGKGDTKRENSSILVSGNPDDMAGNYMFVEMKSNVKVMYKHSCLSPGVQISIWRKHGLPYQPNTFSK